MNSIYRVNIVNHLNHVYSEPACIA